MECKCLIWDSASAFDELNFLQQLDQLRTATEDCTAAALLAEQEAVTESPDWSCGKTAFHPETIP